MLCDPALKVVRCTDVMAASAAQNVNPSHTRYHGSAGTRNRSQRLKSALLYRLRYRPVEIQFVIALRFFNPEPTPKAFGAALPIELPTRSRASVCNACQIFSMYNDTPSDMISHQHKCIFVEVPKTGSTSVRAILGKAWKPHLNLWQIKNQMEMYWTHYGGRKNRILAALYLFRPEEQRKKIGRKQFETYFKFRFVRNPWDRVVLLYERTEELQLRDDLGRDAF